MYCLNTGIVRSSVVSLTPVDENITSFSRPITVTFPVLWYDQTKPNDASSFCLAKFTAIRSWECVNNGPLQIPQKRDDSFSLSALVHSPGEYAILSMKEK